MDKRDLTPARKMARRLFNISRKGVFMRFALLIGHKTHKGPVFIGKGEDGCYYPLWASEPLGRYQSIGQAIDDVAGGHTYTPSDGSDLGALQISDDVADWLPASELM